MTNNIRLNGLFLILLYFCFVTSTTALAQNTRIFILHSYHQEYPWTNTENKGFTQTLNDRFVSESINFSTEYLDTKRVEFNKAYQEFFYRYLKEKYDQFLPDVIFCSDDDALIFLNQFKARLFGDVPVVFCGVNNLEIQENLNRQYYTGVFEKKEIIPNLNLLNEIFPRSKTILFLGDNSPTHRAIEQTIKVDIASQFPEQQYTILANDKLSYLIKQLKIYKQGVIFLTTIGGIKDEHGNVVSLKKALSAIVSSGDFTIISMEDAYLEEGIFGGYVTNGFFQGKIAAELTAQIIQGNTPMSIPLVKEGPNQYMFNYPQLKKFGVAISQLPEKSIVLNKPHSFYDQYKYRIWAAVFFLIIQTLVILVLIQNVRKRKKAESSLLKARDELENKVIERTSELTRTNTTLNNEINERRLTQEILDSQNQLMSTLLDNLQVGVFMVAAPVGKPLLANRRALEMLGRGIMSDADRSTLAEVYQAFKVGTNDIYPTNQLPIVRGLNGEEHSVDDMVVVQPEGNRIYLEVFGTPVRDKNGDVVASLVSFLDITDRKKSEQALINEKEFTETALNSQQDTFFLFEPTTGKALRWNQAFNNITGYTNEEISEMRVPGSYYSPEDLERASFFIDEVIETGIGRIELDLICKDGRKVPTEYNVSVMKDDEGHPKYFISIGRDITDRKKSEDEKEMLEDQLRQALKMEAIGTLAGGIAHDFNNILGIIIGNTELAFDDVPDWNPARNNLNEIKTACLRARDVVRQLLSFSRKSEKLQKPLVLNDIITESIKLLRASIPTTITIELNIPQQSETILADPTQIHQVLINLCTNAAHAMEAEGGVLNVDVKKIHLDERTASDFGEVDRGDYIQLTVSDTGHGILPQIQKKIFDPYFTTKDVGKGSGMGLAVVHGIVKNHSGLISLSSFPGKGTSIKILFPIITEQPKQHKEEVPVEKIPIGTETILFVDDEESIVNLAKMTLTKLGYKVEVSKDPIEALSLFKAKPNHYDLVISDMTMPNMTGDKLTQNLLSINPDVPIIICTGFSERLNKEQAILIGVKGYLTKPVVKSEMSKMIRKVLDDAKGSAHT